MLDIFIWEVKNCFIWNGLAFEWAPNTDLICALVELVCEYVHAYSWWVSDKAPTSIRVCGNKTRAKVEKEIKEKQDRFAAVYRDDIGSPKVIQPHYQYVVNTHT